MMEGCATSLKVLCEGTLVRREVSGCWVKVSGAVSGYGEAAVRGAP
mgnify:CR=1 FL=1